MSNSSQWHCGNCDTLIMPKKLTNRTFAFGFLAVIVPSYFCIFHLKYTLIPSLLIGFAFGILAYCISLIYFYYNTEFEKAK